MSELKRQSEAKMVTAKVVREGTAIVIPDQMALEDAVQVLQLEAKQQQKQINPSVTFGHHPFEVAHAFGLAVEKVCGTALGKDTETMFGPTPPGRITVEVEVGKFVSVMWGRLVFPFDPENSWLEIGATREGGVWVGQCSALIRQKYLRIWEQISSETRNILMTDSMFRGKTLRIKFTDSDGDLVPLPEIKPWDVRNASTAKLVFTSSLEAQIEDHIFTPVRHREKVEAAGTQFKRGILLTGQYGTGKTELAAAVAREASAQGMTVVYIENVRELPHALRFAARLAPAVVFAEDIDRVTDGARNHDVDVLLNTLDGIDTKRAAVMTILTSNYPERIYKGMIRPGRVDVALHIAPPDAEAAVRLVKGYLGVMYTEGSETEQLGRDLAGLIPAEIREICERSKLSCISRTKEIPGPGMISSEDVRRAAASMKNQMELLRDKTPVAEDGHDYRIVHKSQLSGSAMASTPIMQ